MDPENTESLLADYLGDELAPEQRRRFEGLLAENPALQAEVVSLRQTLDELQSLAASPRDDQSGQCAAEPTTSTARVGGRPIRSLLRYAAVIALAFVAGFIVRGPQSDGGVASEITAAGGGSIHPQLPDKSAQRFAQTWLARRGESGLTRSLFALAHASRPAED